MILYFHSGLKCFHVFSIHIHDNTMDVTSLVPSAKHQVNMEYRYQHPFNCVKSDTSFLKSCESKDSGLEVDVSPEAKDPEKTVQTNPNGSKNCRERNGSLQSQTITRLSDDPADTGSELDSFSCGVRTRLGRSLQDSHRDSFAHQVQQLSRPFSTVPQITDHWGAEISQPLSALYSILIIIISACLAFSSQLTTNVDSMYSRYFDSGLLAIGICFLLASFGFLYRKNKAGRKGFLHFPGSKSSLRSNGSEQSFTSFGGYFKSPILCISDESAIGSACSKRVQHTECDSANFYLKMGALSFAIGSMIYACLELGVFVENSSCFNTVMGLNPVLFVLFVILQLYFIFLNSRLTLRKYRTTGRFGLMHLVSTNLCIWIRTLIDETLHAFSKLREENERKLAENQTVSPKTVTHEMLMWEDDTKDGYNPLCVDDESIMKKMMEEASVFLYPCIIEYSLISAGILYIMWTFVGLPSHTSVAEPFAVKKPYTVDCDQAAKGLFLGILLVVLTIVSLILYFLFLDKPGYQEMAVFQAQLTEIILYGVGLAAVVYCFITITRTLQRAPNHSMSMMLDDTLLKISMVGVYAYSIASILGGYAEDNSSGTLSVVAASLCLIQSTAQTIFIFDASQRGLPVPHNKTSPLKTPAPKPARETVTLLLITNFALWATNVFCTLRAESSPSQTAFYGVHEWTVMLHVTVPLVIFYRFHSTACLFEIWKKAYKEKRTSPREPPFAEHVTHV